MLVALALPDIYNSLRHLFGLAFGYIMLAELINAEHGLGYLLMTSQRRGLSEHIILILIIIGLLAYGIDRLLFWFQRGLFPVPRGRTDMTTDELPGRTSSSSADVTKRFGDAHRHPRRHLHRCRTCPTRASSSRSSGRRAAASPRSCG